MSTPADPSLAPLVALTETLGAHAFAGFCVLLAVLLAAVALIDVSLRRVARRRLLRPDAHPFARIFLRLLFGFALIVAAAFAFAELAEEIGPGEELAQLDQVFSDAVRASTPEAVRAAFGWVTHLGDPWTIVLLGVVAVLGLMMRGERVLAFAFVAALAGNALLNTALKHAFERARPLHAHAQALEPTPFAGYSFPSGHSSGALVAYGMLAYVLVRTLPRAWHLPAALLCAGVAFSVGASRIFIQAHFATDVMAGFASGSAWLAICILSVEWAQRERRAR